MPAFLRNPFLLTIVAVAALAAFAPGSYAQTGISDDRVNLPEGPGSLDGIGDNASVNGNMGLMTYSVPIQLPAGFAGTTPELSLAYTSGGGGGLVGIGWDLQTPFIERTTIFELPEYDADDDFSVDGGTQLVRVEAGDPTTYRERNERSFTRYRWRDVGDGAGGYFTAELPDGRVQYYGADASGAEVATARLTGPGGVFRYHLVETVDPYGNRMRYDYEERGTTLVPSRITWAYVDGSPLYEARFAYEERPDVLSDCRPGFNELTEHRLTSVAVRARGTEIRRYVIEYEDPDDSGGFSRVRRIAMLGRDGTEYPIDYSFGYSRALGAVCAGEDCTRPFTRTMPSLGVDVSAGTGTLIDLNGDALPDFIDTSAAGPHRIFYNRLIPRTDGGFDHVFEAPVESGIASGSGFGLRSPYTQVLDVDGDGFTDLLNVQRGEILPNPANGDWGTPVAIAGTTDGLPDFGDDFSEGEQDLTHVRFLDYDNDRRIDIIRSEGSTVTEIFRNTGAGRFVQADGVQLIGAGFQEGIELADMNGDGLRDPVRVLDGAITWKLNLGRGRWSSSWSEPIDGPALTASELDLIELEDLNGDALDDLVLVQGNEVRYWLNRSGRTLDAPRVVTPADVPGIPERTAGTTVLFGDMNGNGSTDVVWITSSGAVTYLELFPVRPNLLTSIETGIGLVTDVTYGTSVEHMARDGGWEAWPNRLPHPMNVVDSIDTYDRLNEVRGVVRYVYRDGFYDGVEKQFRGYAEVEVIGEEDDDQEASLKVSRYYVGDDDPYLTGLEHEVEVYALDGETRIPISRMERVYEDCDVEGVPTSGLRFPVRHVCMVREAETRQERRPAAEWVVVATEMEYDGYGNAVAEIAKGVESFGGGACGACDDATGSFGAACGPQCVGDEAYAWREYVPPTATGGRWILRAMSRERTSAEIDGEYTERRMYYDGDAFEGLALGQLTEGRVRRVSERADTADTFIDVERYDHDEYGNVVESWGPRATAGGRVERTVYTWADGLLVTRADILLSDSTGTPITLRHDVDFDPVWPKPALSTGWYVAEDGDGRPDGVTRYVWDEFERLVGRSLPGDDAITEAYEYELASPASRIVTRRRSVAGGDQDIVNVQCLDGFGRSYQTRDLLEGTSFQVTGYTVFNRHGREIRSYQPYRSTGEACETAPPSGVLFTQTRYDAEDRVISTLLPDEEDRGGSSEARIEYGPLEETSWDPEDLDPESPHYGTPSTTVRDGLNRTVASIRRDEEGRDYVIRYGYDVYGRPSVAVDAEGVVMRQTSSPIGHVLSIEDPHRGVRTFEHDPAGNIIAETDARGVTIRQAFDGFNRQIAQWDDADRDGTLQQWFYDRNVSCPSTRCTNTAGLAAGTSFVVDGVTIFEELGYSVRQEPTRVARTINGVVWEFETDYDNASRSIAERMPGGLELTFERDAFGRVMAVDGLLDAIEYDSRGIPERVVASNGVVTEYTYDARMHMDTMSAARGTGAAVIAYELVRDRVGNVVEIIDDRDIAGRPSSAATVEYDALYRLRQVRLDGGRAGFEEVLDYSWSAGGNLVSRTSSLAEASAQHVPTVTYGGGGAGVYAVTSFGALDFAYDAVGNTTRRGEQELEWDAFHRLVRSAEADGSTGEYAYDSNDVRVWKREDGAETWYLGDRFEIRDGVAVAYIDIDDLRIARIELGAIAADWLSDIAPVASSAGELTPEPDGFITAADGFVAQGVASGTVTLTTGVADDPRALLAASAHRLLLGDDLEARTWYHHNHIGSIVAATDDEGAVWQTTEFYPDGQIRWSSSGGVEDFGYTGKEHDASGLLAFGARYLDPVTGRWISPDPTFGFIDDAFIDRREEATNAYGFALGNPMNNRDKDGRFIDNIVGAVVGGLGGALIAGVSEAVTQWRQTKSGTRMRMNWRRVFRSAAVAGASGALVGASGVSGVGMIAVGMGVRAVVSAATTGMRWRAENAAIIARDPNRSAVERASAEKTYARWQTAARVVDIGAAVVGGVAGVAGAAAGFGASVPGIEVANSLGDASGGLATAGIATTVAGLGYNALNKEDMTRVPTRPRSNAIVRPVRQRRNALTPRMAQPPAYRQRANAMSGGRAPRR